MACGEVWSREARCTSRTRARSGDGAYCRRFSNWSGSGERTGTGKSHEVVHSASEMSR